MSFYYHPPGELSRSAVLDIGLKCTHSCKFCYYSFLGGDTDQFRGMRRAGFRDGDRLKQFLTNLRANGFLGFDVTGGEPTLHPNLVELIAHATEIGLFSRVITLGQFLMRKMRGAPQPLIQQLLDAGLTNFLFSFHSSDEAEFKSLTGESLAKQKEAMDYLGARDFQFATNTVVVAENAKRLPEIARALTATNTYLHNFIIMNSYYEWNAEGRAFDIVPRYTNLLPYIREAIDILHEADIGCNIRYAPLCGLPGLEHHIVGVAGVRYDPYEWMNHESHAGEVDPVANARPWAIEKGSTQQAFQLFGVEGVEGIYAVRGQGGSKVFGDTCQSCTLLHACDGYDPKYIKNYGKAELCTYTEDSSAGVLTQGRRKYVPPFLVKLDPSAQMRAVNRRFLHPEPMAAEPLVSIVVTAFNKQDTIVRAIRAALDQTYPRLEIVVVNDGSTDGTLAAIEEAGLLEDARIVLHDQPNSGQPAAARNAGVATSTGTLILPLDGDDWIHHTYVSEAVAVLVANPSVSIVYSDAVYSRAGIVKARDYDYPTLLFGNQLSYCSLFKREVFDDVEGYRLNVRGVEDWDFWIAAGLRGHFGKRIARPLFHYRQSDDGVFARDVAPDLELKFAQVVLNNAPAYQPSTIAWAEAKLAADAPSLTTAAPARIEAPVAELAVA